MCEKERDHSRGELQKMMLAGTRTKRGGRGETQKKKQSLLHLGVLDAGASMPRGATCGSTKVVRRQKAGAEWEWGNF